VGLKLGVKKIDLKKEKENFKYNSFYNSLIEGGREMLDSCDLSDTFKEYLRFGFLKDPDYGGDQKFQLVNCLDQKKINLLSGDIFSYLDARIKYRNLIVVLQTSEREEMDIDNPSNVVVDIQKRCLRPRYLAELSFDDKPMNFIIKLDNPFVGMFDAGNGYEFEILKKTTLDIQSDIYYNFIEKIEYIPHRYIFANKQTDINLKELKKYKSLNATRRSEFIDEDDEYYYLYFFKEDNFSLPDKNFLIYKEDIDYSLKKLVDSSELFFSENLTYKFN
jgi:hypothetical protein|tara:strand:- start:47 stop:874 length:828 start_codon:yes stop_codon:yes gene_type:complete